MRQKIGLRVVNDILVVLRLVETGRELAQSRDRKTALAEREETEGDCDDWNEAAIGIRGERISSLVR